MEGRRRGLGSVLGLLLGGDRLLEPRRRRGGLREPRDEERRVPGLGDRLGRRLRRLRGEGLWLLRLRRLPGERLSGLRLRLRSGALLTCFGDLLRLGEARFGEPRRGEARLGDLLRLGVTRFGEPRRGEARLGDLLRRLGEARFGEPRRGDRDPFLGDAACFCNSSQHRVTVLSVVPIARI